MKLDYRQLDWKLIGAALALSLIGVLLIYSAQFDAASGTSQNYYVKQLIWVGLALFVFAVVVNIPLRMIDFMAYLFFALSLALLMLVFFIGHAKYGAARWFSLGPINVTPSDIAKLALLIALARFLAYTKLKTNSFQRLLISSVITIVPVAMVVVQPDLGTSMVFVALLFSLWFWVGAVAVLYLIDYIAAGIASDRLPLAGLDRLSGYPDRLHTGSATRFYPRFSGGDG